MSNNSDDAPPPQAEATSSTIRNRIDDLALQNLIEGSKKPDPTYLSIWNMYKKWANERQDESSPIFPPYCHRDILDLFFVSFIAKKSWAKSYARKHVSALQFFADYDVTEHAGKSPRFIVETPTITQALDCMQTRLGNEKKRSRDPHANLPTDILSYNDELKLLREGIINRITWADFAVSWTWGTSCFIRGHSMRASYARHLLTLDSYGADLKRNTLFPELF